MTTIPLVDPSTLQTFYNNPECSDVKIVFSDKSIHAHKMHLMCTSQLFCKAFRSNFDLHDTYNIEGHPNRSVYAMVRHIYGFKSDDVLESEEGDVEEEDDEDEDEDEARMTFYLDVYLIANEYFVISLKEAVTKIIHDWMRKTYRKERKVFAMILESIIFFEKSYAIDASSEDSNNDSDGDPKTSLFRKAALFCVQYQPAYVVKVCSKPDKRYHAFAEEMSTQIMCGPSLMHPGCMVCLFPERTKNSRCWCGVRQGDWPEAFDQFIEGWHRRLRYIRDDGHGEVLIESVPCSECSDDEDSDVGGSDDGGSDDEVEMALEH